MAWMRMMGADSVGYHERTVLGRSDDPVGGALEYYASRGETPMAWGGAGAACLGLDSEVDIDEWRAIFGTGGARHPKGSERLVHCMRPGMMAAAARAVELGYGSSQMRGVRGASAVGPSPGYPKKPGKYMQTARHRSKRPSGRTPPTAPARWRRALHGTVKATSESRTSCRAGGVSWLGQATQPPS
jgi:TrwC relaxase